MGGMCAGDVTWPVRLLPLATAARKSASADDPRIAAASSPNSSTTVLGLSRESLAKPPLNFLSGGATSTYWMQGHMRTAIRA